MKVTVEVVGIAKYGKGSMIYVQETEPMDSEKYEVHGCRCGQIWDSSKPDLDVGDVVECVVANYRYFLIG